MLKQSALIALVLPSVVTPWNVSLRSADGAHDCGAVLIAPKWLLTSGRCVAWAEKNPSGLISVWGDMSPEFKLTLLPKVKSVHIAPFFVENRKNNLGLVELESEVTFPPAQSDGQRSPSLQKTGCSETEGSGLIKRGENGFPELVSIANENAECGHLFKRRSNFTEIAPFRRWINEKTGRFELYQPENADYRDWTFSELAVRAGATKESLKSYLCNGKTENQLLPELARKNEKGDSLRVISKDGKSFLTYRRRRFYDESGERVTSFSDPFFIAASKNLSALERTPSGEVLISRLQHSPYLLKIKNGGPRFSPENDEGVAFRGLEMAQALQYFTTLRRADYDILPFKHVGAGGYIFFPPDFKAEFIESDNVKRFATAPTVLAHEMYHAFDSIRGLLDRRWANGKGFESLEITEFRAVAFENQIREETGLLYRKYYGTDADPNGGVLNAQGRPIQFSSTCLLDIPL